MSQPVCLITGAGDGIGAAIARRFTKDGYRVAMLARTEERLKRLESEMPGSKGYVCDISDLDLLRETASKVHKELGPATAVMAAVKTAIDPDNIMNPGKII